MSTPGHPHAELQGHRRLARAWRWGTPSCSTASGCAPRSCGSPEDEVEPELMRFKTAIELSDHQLAELKDAARRRARGTTTRSSSRRTG